MSDREEFENWFDANQVSPFDPYDQEKKTVMWEAWQAARAQGDAEPVAFGIFYEGVFQEHAWNEEAANAIAAEDYHGLSGITVQPVYTRPPAAKVPDWTNRLNTCKHHGNDHESCAVYGGRVPCDAEGGEAVPKCYVDRLERLLGGIENIRRNAGGDGYLWGYANAMHRDLKELLSTTPQPDKWIPEGWRVLRMPELQKAISSGPVISLVGPNHETLTFFSDSDERRERDTYAFFDALLSAAPPEQESE